MTPSQRELGEALVHASPAGFARIASRGTWIPARHLLLLAERLAAVERGEVRRLAVFMPPRHGKSELISHYMPAWFLGRNREKRVMLASATAKLSSLFGRQVRDEMEEWGPTLFGVRVRQDSKAADRWDLLGHRGGMVTAGVGGQLTGLGADLLIIDDPIKDAAEAMSEVVRDNHYDWWTSTARPRLHPGAGVVLVQTRWHEGDLAGRLVQAGEDGGDKWEVLSLPAVAGEHDDLGRKPGETLWPERWEVEDPDFYEATKRALGPYFWSALYQQTPTPDEGGIFARQYFRYFEIQGGLVRLHQADGTVKDVGIEWCRKFQVVDIAASEKQTADYTVVCEVWVTPDREMLVRHVIRARIPGPDQPGFLADHSTGVPIKVEGAFAYGTSVIQGARRRGLPVEPVYPDADKVTRASTAGVMYRAGTIYHLRGAEWLHDFELELLSFPASEHDDQVDAIAYAARAVGDVAKPKRQKRTGQTVTGGALTREL